MSGLQLNRSVPSGKLRRMIEAWGSAVRRAGWALRCVPLPDDLMGVTDHERRTIWLHRGLTRVQQLSTLAHEIFHAARGPVPDCPRLAAHEEEACEQAAARALIRLRPLGEALAWSTSMDEAADELGVDRQLLEARLRSLRGWERDYLTVRTEHLWQDV